MAAPGSAYSPKLWYKYDTGQTDNQGLLIRLPRALKEYATLTPTHDEWSELTEEERKVDTNFLNLFHLDLAKHYQFTWVHGDPEVSETMHCVAGFLQESNSPNAVFHNLHTGSTGDGAINRKGKPRIRVGNTNYFMLNDGGLNTRPYAAVHDITLCAENYISFRIVYTNAYWCNTVSCQAVVSLYQNNAATSSNTLTVNISRYIQTVARYKVDENDPVTILLDVSNIPATPSATRNDYIGIHLKISNDEGTYEQPNEVKAQVKPEIHMIDVYKLSGDYTYNSANPPVISGVDLSQNPYNGTRYTVLLKPEFYDPPVSHEGKPYTLYNFFGNEGGAGQSGSGDTPAANLKFSLQSENPIMLLCGNQGINITEAGLTTPLPTGTYYGFPAYWQSSQEADPPPGNKILYIETSTTGGVPDTSIPNIIGWAASSYTPGGGGGGGSTHYCDITNITASITYGSIVDPGSMGTSAAEITQDQLSYHSLLRPSITFTVAADEYAGIAPINIKIYKAYIGVSGGRGTVGVLNKFRDYDIGITKEVTIEASPSASQTITLQIVDAAESSGNVGPNQIGVFEDYFDKEAINYYMSTGAPISTYEGEPEYYGYIMEVSDPYGDAIATIPIYMYDTDEDRREGLLNDYLRQGN